MHTHINTDRPWQMCQEVHCLAFLRSELKGAFNFTHLSLPTFQCIQEWGSIMAAAEAGEQAARDMVLQHVFAEHKRRCCDTARHITQLQQQQQQQKSLQAQ